MQIHVYLNLRAKYLNIHFVKHIKLPFWNTRKYSIRVKSPFIIWIGIENVFIMINWIFQSLQTWKFSYLLYLFKTKKYKILLTILWRHYYILCITQMFIKFEKLQCFARRQSNQQSMGEHNFLVWCKNSKDVLTISQLRFFILWETFCMDC